MENSGAFDLLKAGDTDALRQLLKDDPGVCEASDAAGVSLLMHCIYRGRLDLAELIAGQKKSLTIFESASLGRIERLKVALAELAENEGRDDAFLNPSLKSSLNSSLNSRSKDGFTALHFSCFFGQPEAARLLIESGAEVGAVAANATQVTPLHSAASARNLEAARLLLEHGASVNARQQAGWAAIHAAAQNGDRPMIDLLLRHHADANLCNDEGKTAAMIAKEKGHQEIAGLLESLSA